MKFLLFVEGDTERGEAKRRTIPDLLKRWLDPQLSQRIGIQAVKFKGVRNYLDDVAQKAQLRLEPDVIAIIGIVDLYGLPLEYPKDAVSVDDKIRHARNHVTGLIPRKIRDRFRQHFAVHEIEAWLLSDPSLFTPDIRLPPICEQPERVDFSHPPSSRLDEWYKQAGRGGYRKTTQAMNLFPRLNVELAYSKCPNLRGMLDEMLSLAKAARG